MDFFFYWPAAGENFWKFLRARYWKNALVDKKKIGWDFVFEKFGGERRHREKSCAGILGRDFFEHKCWGGSKIEWPLIGISDFSEKKKS